MSYPFAAPVNSTTTPTVPTAQVVQTPYLSRKNSSGARLLQQAFAVSSSSANLTPEFFSSYDKVVSEYNSLSYVDSHISQKDAEIKDCENNISVNNRWLAENRKKQPKLSKRIQRNEHPHFFHYMQFKREEKVSRLKGEMESLLKDEEKYVGVIKTYTAKLQKSKMDLAELQRKKSHRQALYQKSKQMFDTVVESVPHTAKLDQVLRSVAAQTSENLKEEQLMLQIDQVIATLRRAEQYYRQSINILLQAQRDNRTAAVANFGNGGGFEGLETYEQARRDREINAAQRPVTEAGIIMEQAWTMFPPIARQRYPSLCAQIGRSPLPKLRSAHFGRTLGVKFIAGDIGDAFNDAHAAGKIRENLQIVQQCMFVCESQIQLVIALRSSISATVDKMKANLRNLKKQEQNERQRIFNGQRDLVCNQYVSTASLAFKPSQVMAVPVTEYSYASPNNTIPSQQDISPSAPPPAIL